MNDAIFNLDTGMWMLAFACAAVVGMSKCGIAGLGSVAVPMMAMVIPARASTGVMLPVLIIGDAMGVAHFNRHANWRLLFRLMPAAMVGIYIGYLLMSQPWLNDTVIKRSMGVIVLLLCLINSLRSKFNFSLGNKEKLGGRTLAIALIVGVVAGITTMIANAAGPVMVIYLLTMGLPKDEFIGTSAWYFMILNWAKVPFMMNLGLINASSILFDLKLAPFILLGGILGIILTGCLSEKRYKFWIQALTVLAALKLLF